MHFSGSHWEERAFRVVSKVDNRCGPPPSFRQVGWFIPILDSLHIISYYSAQSVFRSERERRKCAWFVLRLPIHADTGFGKLPLLWFSFFFFLHGFPWRLRRETASRG